MLDWTEAMQGVKSMADAAQGLLHLIRQLRPHVQSRELQREIQEKIREFEQAKIAADVQIAQGLGYALCRCSYPPQICTKTGLDDFGREKSQCPSCGQRYPLRAYIPTTAKRYGSWMSR
jgi:hypothetical protein